MPLRKLTDCFDLSIDVLQAMLAVACRPSQCRKHNSSRSTRRSASSSTTWIAAGRRLPSRRYASDCATGTATCRCLTSTCSSRCSRCLWPTRKSTSPVRASDSIRSPHPTVPLTPKVFVHYSIRCSCARFRSRRTPSHVSRSLAALGARAGFLSSSPVSSPNRIDSISLIDWSANLSGRDGQPFQRMHKHSRNRYIHYSYKTEYWIRIRLYTVYALYIRLRRPRAMFESCFNAFSPLLFPDCCIVIIWSVAHISIIV